MKWMDFSTRSMRFLRMCEPQIKTQFITIYTENEESTVTKSYSKNVFVLLDMWFEARMSVSRSM